MAEYTYTYENIIIDPSKECIKNIIGKDVYFNNNPSLCLAGANEKSTVSLGVLVEIHKDSITPFVVERNDTDLAYSCIIEKKEEEPKYVPFESKEEFIETFHYHDNANYSETEDILLNYGMWLKDTDRDVYCLVTEIWSYGVVVGDSRINTIKDGDEYYTINEVTKWETLLREYTFLDGTPCGKLMEESNA